MEVEVGHQIKHYVLPSVLNQLQRRNQGEMYLYTLIQSQLNFKLIDLFG